MTNRKSRRGLKTSFLALAAALSLSTTAIAQPGGGGRGGFFAGESAFSPAITRTELDSYSDILALSDEQREVANLLLEGYVQQFQAQSAAARERMQRLMDEARESRDREAWFEVGRYRQEFQTSAEKMESSFFSDLRAVLTPDQEARWTDMERTRRRERTLAQGQMSGERVDIIRIARELAPDQSGPLAEILTQYELDLDRALVRRNEVYTSMRDQFSTAGRPDFSRMGDLFERARDASKQVRDVNERYARQVLGTLPDDLRPGFEQRVREASFPQVYRASRTSQHLTAAAAFEDLNESQREQVTSLTASYQRESATLNDRLSAAWRKAEDTMEIREMFRGGLNEGELGELRNARRELDQSYAEKLRAVLSEEQLDRLPRIEEPRDGFEGRGQGPRRGVQQLTPRERF